MESGSEVHKYLDSELSQYYYGGENSYIRATEAAEEYVDNHQDLYQDVTEPTDESRKQTNLARRDLVLELVSLTQELGELPSADQIDEYGEHRFKDYVDEFGDLYRAFQVSGILPDSVKRSDFYGEKPEEQEKVSEEQDAEPETQQPTKQSDTTNDIEDGVDEDESTTAEVVGINVSKLDIDRPEKEVPDSLDESDLINEIQRFGDMLGEPPTEELVTAYGRYPGEEYSDQFGSWEGALDAAGYDADDLPDWNLRKFTNVEVLDCIRAVADELGRPPMTTEMGDYVEFSSGLGSIRFGSWATALELAGLDPSERPSAELGGSEKHEEEPPGRHEEDAQTGTNESIGEDNDESPSRQELLDELKRVDESLDRIPYTSDINEESAFTAHDYQEEFGSWDDALEAIGIDKEAELLNELQRVSHVLGKKPTQQEMSEHSMYSFGMYANFFGSWSGAKDRLNDWESDELSQPSQEGTQSVHQEKGEPDSKDEQDDDNDTIGSIIDETLEEMMQLDDDDGL